LLVGSSRFQGSKWNSRLDATARRTIFVFLRLGVREDVLVWSRGNFVAVFRFFRRGGSGGVRRRMGALSKLKKDRRSK
jgi:hypothetical protein